MYLVTLTGNGLAARDLQLSGDVVVPGVEAAVAGRGAAFEPSFEGGAGEEGRV